MIVLHSKTTLGRPVIQTENELPVWSRKELLYMGPSLFLSKLDGYKIEIKIPGIVFPT